VILTTLEEILNVFSVMLLVWQVWVDSTNNPHREEKLAPTVISLGRQREEFLIDCFSSHAVTPGLQ